MRRTLVAGVVAAALVGVAGCGADEPRPRIAEPTATTTTASADPTDDPEAETKTEPPELSDVARQPTLDGAVAFTNYFWEVTTYAQKSGDVSELRDLVNRGCDTCLGAIDAIKRSTRGSREVSGGEITVSNARAQLFSPSADQTGAAVKFTTTNKPQVVRSDGQVVERFSAATLQSRFLLLHTAAGWRVDIWRIEGP